MANPGPPYILDPGDRWTRKVELGKVGLQTLTAFHGPCTPPTHSPNTYLSRRAPRGQRACSPAPHTVNLRSVDARAVTGLAGALGCGRKGREEEEQRGCPGKWVGGR